MIRNAILVPLELWGLLELTLPHFTFANRLLDSSKAAQVMPITEEDCNQRVLENREAQLDQVR
jgi:hypothetical protein